MKRMTVLKKWKENGNGNKRNEKNIIRRLPPLKKRRSYYGKIKKKITEFEIEIKTDNNTSIRLHEKLIANLEKKLSDIQARELSQWEAQVDPDPTKRMPQHIFQALNSKLTKEREETEKAFAGADFDWEYVFVNDGSKDNTWEIIQNLSNNNEYFKGISLSRK